MEPPPVRYVTTADGKQIAYTVTGNRRALVFLPLSLNHVQLSWRDESRLTAGWLQGLTDRFCLVRYDSRGQGMSTRGLGPDHSIEDYDFDLKAVIQDVGLSRFVVLAYAWFAHVAIRFVAAHPEHVDALILVSPTAEISAWPLEVTIGLIRHSWDIYLRSFVPDSLTKLETERHVAYFHQASTPEEFERHTLACSASDVSDLLATLGVPVLIIHPRDFLWVSISQVESVAGLIPGSRLVLIDGNMAFGDANQAMRAIDDFLLDLSESSDQEVKVSRDGLSRRESEVLGLVALGCSNQQIADRLGISINTVARHVASILAKTGARNRTEAAFLARERVTPPSA